ncbi:MAG TPA: hypothetical protein VGN72_01815 [Tepidisphaeraceae bacterium]|jgi:hypothetical protein|nr:hypothetical protein [Tepidisphaeraceae bacterium]
MATTISPELSPRVAWSDRLLSLADAYRKPIFIAILLLYLMGFNGQWRPEPDAALYLSIGRNLAEGNGYTYHGEPHHLAYPGLPWLWAGVYTVAPQHAIVVGHVIMLLTGLACLALCYRLFLLHAGRPTAVFITLGLAVSRMFYRYSFELRSDMPFLLGVLAFLCGFEAIVYHSRARADDDVDAPRRAGPRWHDWLLLLAGLALAVVMRPTMWALVGAAFFATVRLMFMGRARWALAGIVLVAAIMIGFLRLDPRRVQSTSTFGQYEQALLEVARDRTDEFLNRMLTVNLPGLFDPAASEAMFGLDLGFFTIGGVRFSFNVIGSIVAIGIGLSLFRYRFIWGLLYLFMVLMMLAVLPLDRYFLPVLPLTVYGWWRFLVYVEKRLPGNWGRIAFVALFLLGSGTNFAKIVRWIYDQHQRPFLVKYRDGRYVHWPEIGRVLHDRLPDNAWIVSPYKTERILTFYSERNVTGVGLIDAPSLQLLADVDRAYVLNPADETVAPWLNSTQLQLAPPIATVGDPETTGWVLHPIQWKNPARALPSPEAPATEAASPPAAGGAVR